MHNLALATAMRAMRDACSHQPTIQYCIRAVYLSAMLLAWSLVLAPGRRWAELHPGFIAPHKLHSSDHYGVVLLYALLAQLVRNLHSVQLVLQAFDAER